jgi:hypothetical protein
VDYIRFNGEQTKVLANATQVFEALEALSLEDPRLAGSMHWKRIGRTDYLYRGYTGGRSQSLGPRSAETEDVKERFEEGKAEHRRRTKSLVEQVELHAAYVKANRLGRFPRPAARVVRAFQQAGIPVRVIGTNALHVYEISAGVLFLPEHVATEDVDVLLDDRQGVKIAGKLGARTLLSIVQKADRSFRRLTDSPAEFTAVDDRGYRVDLVTQGRRKSPIRSSELAERLAAEDLRPVEIPSLEWLLASPHYSEVVFDEGGMPVRVDTVDPRAFVIFKHFVSQQDDRRPAKRRRDAEHARVVAELLRDELRHLAPSPAIEKLFPRAVARKARRDTGEDS